jgi:hypothetical protein
MQIAMKTRLRSFLVDLLLGCFCLLINDDSPETSPVIERARSSEEVTLG